MNTRTIEAENTRGLVRLTDEEIAILGSALDLLIDDRRRLADRIASGPELWPTSHAIAIDCQVVSIHALAAKLSGVL